MLPLASRLLAPARRQERSTRLFERSLDLRNDLGLLCGRV